MVAYICFYSFEGIFVENRIFEIKPSDYSLVRPRKKQPDYSLFTQEFPTMSSHLNDFPQC